MRDLIFTVNGNYAHQTLTTGLQNSIQTPTAAPTTTVLPNGNTLLPNGTIMSPTGQPVGQATAAAGSSVPLLVNPSNQFTGTFSVDKIFNRAVISLSGSINRTEYRKPELQPNFNSRTLTENAAVWLGPLIYAYSNGSAHAPLWTTQHSLDRINAIHLDHVISSDRGTGHATGRAISRFSLFWTSGVRGRRHNSWRGGLWWRALLLSDPRLDVQRNNRQNDQYRVTSQSATTIWH